MRAVVQCPVLYVVFSVKNYLLKIPVVVFEHVAKNIAIFRELTKLRFGKSRKLLQKYINQSSFQHVYKINNQLL